MTTDVMQDRVYTLLVPVELKSTKGEVLDTLTELTFRRLKGSDARKVLNAKDKGTGEFVAALVCASAGIPPSTFDQLDAADIFKAGELASDFFGVSPTT
ncbi:phage tail assembly protein [Roseateles sp. DXS20W]|uniref:Phage tail assembly protein n=1 Tax=Pelomonas lactea TaxID=3299030 RepID=A0ABW7GJX8_9BURK